MFFKSYSCWYCITPPKSSSTCLTFSKNTFKCEIIGPNGVKKQCFEPNKGWGWMSNLTLRKGWNTFIIHSLFGTRCFLGQPPVSRALSLFAIVHLLRCTHALHRCLAAVLTPPLNLQVLPPFYLFVAPSPTCASKWHENRVLWCLGLILVLWKVIRVLGFAEAIRSLPRSCVIRCLVSGFFFLSSLSSFQA